VPFVGGDKACSEKYVWQCRKSAGDWCSMREIETTYAYLAWRLVEGVPEVVETIEEARKTEEVVEE